MITMEFEFPVKEDAYKFRDNAKNFFSGLFQDTEYQLILEPIKKNTDNDRATWNFKIIFRKDENDNNISERYIKIHGGTLDLMNGTRQVWAFA